ncbi:MAG: hypothetical protein ACREJC_11100 [Tepidisphaeraceae bacterium]
MKLPVTIGLIVSLAQPIFAQSTQPTTRPSERLAPADQILSQMLKPTANGSRPLRPVSDPPLPDRTSGAGAVAPNAPTLRLIREGTFIMDRTGRLTQTPDGQWTEFTFDSDGRALSDPPVVILPNLKLAQMETAVSASSRDLRFRITGMVTEYKGRNYVLLEKAVVVPD